MTARNAPVPGPVSLGAEELARLEMWLCEQVSANLDPKTPPGYLRETGAREILVQAYSQTRLSLPEARREELFSRVMISLFGYGPLQPLFDDPGVTEILINGPASVYVERKGRIESSGLSFEKREHLQDLVDRMLHSVGMRADASNPLVDARLADGSRINVAVQPAAVDGPCLTIRRLSRERLTLENLVALGTLSSNLAEFLRACVAARLNILVSGGQGAGKTTLLNSLAACIPPSERVISIEEATELQIQHPHLVRLEGRLASTEGHGAVTLSDLVANALRMHPDRLVVGELRGPEALQMLQAMNTGHEGCLMTIQANSPREATSRLETLCQIAGMDVPARVIREQITSAVDLVVQVARLRDGSRKIASITEIAGMEGETIVHADVFRFIDEGLNPQGKVTGQLRPTGQRPFFAGRLEAVGYRLPVVLGSQAETISVRLR